jgi:seryl-tRNA synthetase
LLLVFTACTNNTAEYENKINTLQKENIALEQKNSYLQNQLKESQNTISQVQATVESLNKKQSELEYKNSELQQQIDNFRDEVALTNTDVVVTVIDKVNYPESWDVGRYSPFVSFTFQVTNNTDKEIRGIQGTHVIKDMFGAEIMELKLDFTETPIPAKSSIIVKDMGFEVNRFTDSHVKVYQTDGQNLQFEYNVLTILFTDGTTKKAVD